MQKPNDGKCGDAVLVSAHEQVGLVGNTFVVAAVVMYPGMRSITNFFITSLAIADLLIICFCLPATLMNNVLTGLCFFPKVGLTLAGLDVMGFGLTGGVGAGEGGGASLGGTDGAGGFNSL